jgi:hypothetical protein
MKKRNSLRLKVSDNAEAFVAEMESETNARAVIILCHAAVDEFLTDLLKRRLHECKTRDSLFDG